MCLWERISVSGMNKEDFTERIVMTVRSAVQHFDPYKYFRLRSKVICSGGVTPYRLFLLFRIKRMDAFNNASLGTHLGYGARFKGVPNFPHGLYGIIVSHNAVIGENVTIYHQVTIGEGAGGAPIIGDNVLIGAGAKIIGGITIGNNVKIGAGCVVVDDVPDNATVVMQKARVIYRDQ